MTSRIIWSEPETDLLVSERARRNEEYYFVLEACNLNPNPVQPSPNPTRNRVRAGKFYLNLFRVGSGLGLIFIEFSGLGSGSKSEPGFNSGQNFLIYSGYTL